MIDPEDQDQTRSAAVLMVGDTVAHYHISRLLGSGGMGEVYLAQDTRLDRLVALKFASPALAGDAGHRERFIREAKAAARLHHPNIISIFEVSEHRGRPFFAMEYVEGQSLRDLARNRALTLDQVIQISRQICEALGEAHSKGILHRDIKTSNIVVEPSGRARLLDFGLAISEGDVSLTKPGTTLGTFAYMSPEQVQGLPVDARSDLFSTGVVIYEMIAGYGPFERDSSAATLNAILTVAPLRPSGTFGPIPDELWRLLERMLQRDPSNRYQTAAEAAKALSDLLVQNVADLTPRQPSIAVLPFSNMSDDPQQEHFCDGIAEDIINDLSHIGGLRVVARTSAFSFKGKAADLREIGRQLNVETILEGSVRKVGNRLRITTQLIKVADGFHIWSERYDREMSDIFAIQDDIACNVVERLKGYLLPDSPVRRARRVDVKAYRAYSQGRYYLNLRTAEGFLQALASFREALAIEPDSALGYAGLADTYFLMFAYDLAEPRDTVGRARSTALRALELDDSISEAHTTLGGILCFYDWAWDDAEVAYRRALVLNPSYATAHQWYAELLTFRNRFDQAEHQFAIARELDPLAEIVSIMYGVLLMRTGRIEAAVNEFGRVVGQGSHNDSAYAWYGFSLMLAGRTDEGLKQFTLGRKVANDSPFSAAMEAHAHALTGDLGATSSILSELHRRREKEYITPALLAALHLDLKQYDAGHRLLREAIRSHNSELIFLAIMPYYAKLREDPTTALMLGILEL